MTADQLALDDAALTPEQLARQFTERTFVPDGIYDIPNSVYHASGGLSSSGARKMIEPSCPALFKHERDNPPEPKAHFDFGHAAHRLALGAGDDLVTVHADDWRSKTAREQRDGARDAGLVPLLAKDMETVHAMAVKLAEHPLAMKLFSNGLPEQSLFWRDKATGIQCRARLDWLGTTITGHKRLIVPEYKTAASVAPDDFMKAAANWWYSQQAAWNSDAVRALGLAADVAFVFVAQMKTPPYLVELYEPDANALRIGRIRNRDALHIYARCMETGVWPGFSDRVEFLPLPRWIENQYPEGVPA